MSGFITEELSQRVNRIRDDQARVNASSEIRFKVLEAEARELRNRLNVLTRLLISRQIATAEEIATALAAALAPPPAATPETSPPATTPTTTEAATPTDASAGTES
jgi:hypothetical protein